MTSDPRERHRTWIGRWEPRWLVAGYTVLAAGFLVERSDGRAAPTVEDHLLPVVAAAVISTALCLLSGLRGAAIVRRLRGVAFFLALLVFVFSISYPTVRGVRFGGIEWSPEGFLVALTIACRAFAVVLLAASAVAALGFETLLKTLRWYRVPAPLLDIAHLAHRYARVYDDQLGRLRDTMRTRGFRARTNARTLRAIGHGLGALLVGSVDRVETIRDAMVSRGFHGHLQDTTPRASTPGDAGAFVVAALVGTTMAWWQLT